jgi:NADH-quinone oxidoreductase subunit C
LQPDATPISKALSRAGVPYSAEVEGLAGVVVRVPPDAVGAALAALRDSERRYEFMVDLFGIDTGEAIDVVYFLRSLGSDDEVKVRTTLQYGGDLASVWKLYPAALMPERECAEMFGLTLSGHPNPKRLLTTDKHDTPLLLKSVAIRTPEEVRHR